MDNAVDSTHRSETACAEACDALMVNSPSEDM